MRRTYLKRPWCWERLRVGGEGDDRGLDGCMALSTWWTWVWAALGVGDRQGGLVCCSPQGCKESDMTKWLNWTDLITWSSKPLATWCELLTHWERPWCWEGLRAGEVGDKQWDGWMASLTQWTWVWANQEIVNNREAWWTGPLIRLTITNIS